MADRLIRLEPGTPIVFGGDKVTRVSRELAEAFSEGDRLIVVNETGDLLHVPHQQWQIAREAVDAAAGAFVDMGMITNSQVTDFYERFAESLEDEIVFSRIAEANQGDVERATALGRSTTRLILSETMRKDMIEGLRGWARADFLRGEVVEEKEHTGWRIRQIKAGLGVVAFVFEGRPNVLADATGVLRMGNTVVFRIGSDALGTARAMMDHAAVPALRTAGLPAGAVSLVDSRAHASGWALFADQRIAVAVARGSGEAASQLGAVARQSGVPVSLHGMGGAWPVAGESAHPEEFRSAVYHSLDRKVCNTLNTVCIVSSRADDLVPTLLEALQRAGDRNGANPKLHVTENVSGLIPDAWFEPAEITRAGGIVLEAGTQIIDDDGLGTEWEWERSPEVTLTLVPDVKAAVSLFNAQSPRFIASLISSDDVEHERFFETVDAPFVGNGFTRWVDGQYALGKPELGLSNWQSGRLFGRGGILTGDSVITIRSRAVQEDPDLGR